MLFPTDVCGLGRRIPPYPMRQKRSMGGGIPVSLWDSPALESAWAIWDRYYIALVTRTRGDPLKTINRIISECCDDKIRLFYGKSHLGKIKRIEFNVQCHPEGMELLEHFLVRAFGYYDLPPHAAFVRQVDPAIYLGGGYLGLLSEIIHKYRSAHLS